MRDVGEALWSAVSLPLPALSSSLTLIGGTVGGD